MIVGGGNNAATTPPQDARAGRFNQPAASAGDENTGARFGILGPVVAWCAGQPLDLGGPRQLTLLGLLITHASRPVSTDALIEEVWGAGTTGAGKRLSVAVSRLRRALEPLDRDGRPLLRTVDGGYLLMLEPGDLDAWAFETLTRQGVDALEADAAAVAGARLRDALALWRGPAFGELGGENALRGEAQRLEELRMSAVEARLDADLRLGGTGSAIPELRSLVSENPTRERLARLLMTALYRSGRQADALAVYGDVRAHLRDELGLDPGPELRTLQAEILRQSPALGPVASRTSTPPEGVTTPGSVATMLVALISEPRRPDAAPREPHVGAPLEIDPRLAAICARHQALRVVAHEDGVLAIFQSPELALTAAVELADWAAATGSPAGKSPQVRLGIHTGRLRTGSSGPWGEDVHLAAGLAHAANDGQVLVSAATTALVPGVCVTDLGERRIEQFATSMRVFGLGVDAHRRPRTGDPLRSNLPASTDELIGREREQAELMAMVSAGDDRLITITGAGGLGKTSLALAIAREWVDVLSDGAFLVPLAQLSAASGVTAAIAATLGIPLDAADDPGEAIARALADREILLVLDNFEHVLDAASLLPDLLGHAPRLRMLVTSQEPLRVRPERVVRLGPLTLPAADDLRSVAGADATRLLVLRAQRANPLFRLSDENASGLARLARTLDGLPLAIELAAARLQLLSPDQLLARLDRGTDALGHGSRDLPDRQRGLRAALDWTHELLSDDEAVLLRRLGAFAGPVSLDRIEHVTGGDQLDALARLYDLSLIVQTGDGRLRQHPGVRRYARDKLAAAGETDQLARDHAAAFAHAAEHWGRRVLFDVGAIESAAVSEEADIGQALSWAATHDLDSFARLAGGAAPALLFTARLAPYGELIERALTHPGVRKDTDAAAGPALPAASRAWLVLAGGLAAFQRREIPLAQTRLAEACTAADQSGDRWLAGLMRTHAIIFAVLAGTTDGLRDQYEVLTERVRALRDQELLALIHGLEPYILAYCERRDAEAAAVWSSLAEERTRTDFAAWTAPFCLPDCHLLAGDHSAALAGFRAALRSAREDALEAAGWAGSVRRTAGPAVNRWYRELLDQSLGRSRAVLDAHVCDAAYARGLALPLDAAIDAALALDHPHPAPRPTGATQGS